MTWPEVGVVAQVDAGELPGKHPGDREIVRRDLVRNWHEVAVAGKQLDSR
jgi:hypothetical protein